MPNEEFLQKAKDFFESQKKEMGKIAKSGKKALIISFNELASFDVELANLILDKPDEMIALLEVALDELELIEDARVRFNDLPEAQHVQIKNIRAKHLGRLISIEGIVRQSSDVRPQVDNAKFECPTCGTLINVIQLEKGFKEPNRCSNCGRRAGFKLISKQMLDTQKLEIEEAPESLDGGAQPRRLTVFLKEDLVEPIMEEKTTPGSKIRIIGILKEVPITLKTGKTSTRFDLAIDANNVITLEETFEEIQIEEEDEKQIKELSVDPEVYDKLAESIAPSIFGYPELKLAMILQLMGGVRKQKSDGIYSRGDIHMLLVGDPGVAKSVILKFMSTVAPKGRYVIGKSATGAGLTATVIKDELMRGWSLEAGAIVLANKGLACIDELDKMSDHDRSAMHEAMEQQTVTITKANIQATLRAETSILAAANPNFGRFNPQQSVPQQIHLEPTLINRFDLIFVLRDIPQRDKDEKIADHVLKEHKEKVKREIISSEFLRKYVAYAKQNIKPELTQGAMEEIKNFYVDLRNMQTISQDIVRPIPISARQLEGLVRLSQASAKVRLSNKVLVQDAKRAINIMKYYLYTVGYDEETKSIDIDRIATGISASERQKIILVRETINKLEGRLGKLIPITEIFKELEGKIEIEKIEKIIEKLNRSGEIFMPRKGHLQKVG